MVELGRLDKPFGRPNTPEKVIPAFVIFTTTFVRGIASGMFALQTGLVRRAEIAPFPFVDRAAETKTVLRLSPSTVPTPLDGYANAVPSFWM